MAISSYGKIWNLGLGQTRQLFDGPVVVQEKIDGSYFSFGLIDGRLQCRSKSALIDTDAPVGMFSKAVEVVKSLKNELTPNYVYCCEYLQKPKHNALAYDRIPKNHLVLFDVEIGGRFLDMHRVALEACRLGLEECPQFFAIHFRWNEEKLKGLLDTPSLLGGQKIEGVVVKNYNEFDAEGNVLRGKLVGPTFKEINNDKRKEKDLAQEDIRQELGEIYRSTARWHKAVQHLSEAGQLTGEPKDIGPLMKEVNKDVLEECSFEIKEKLFQWAWKTLSREITKGLPDWYKEQLMLESAHEPSGSTQTGDDGEIV